MLHGKFEEKLENNKKVIIHNNFYVSNKKDILDIY